MCTYVELRFVFQAMFLVQGLSRSLSLSVIFLCCYGSVVYSLIFFDVIAYEKYFYLFVKYYSGESMIYNMNISRCIYYYGTFSYFYLLKVKE